jgi:hypothetical protein
LVVCQTKMTSKIRGWVFLEHLNFQVH